MNANTLPKLAHCMIAAVCSLWAGGLLLPVTAFGALHIEGIHFEPLADFDSRDAAGVIAPTSGQESAAAALGTSVHWNKFGTPASLVNHGGFLAEGLSSDPETAARAFLNANAELFRLTAGEVAALELDHIGEFANSPARAVGFRQEFGGLPPGGDSGVVTVGVVNGKVAMVSSSIVDVSGAPPAAVLTPVDAVLTAALDAGVGTGAVTGTDTDGDWTTVGLNGVAQLQRTRLRAFPTPSGVKAAYETDIVEALGPDGATKAYIYFIDAVSGEILYRNNAVQRAMDASAPDAIEPVPMPEVPEGQVFQGTYTGSVCGPGPTNNDYHGPFTAPPGYQRVQVFASAIVPVDDILIKLYFDAEGGSVDINLVATFDLLFSPEQGTYESSEPGDYYVQVCAFEGQDPLFVGTYAGSIVFDDTPAAAGEPDPRWLSFPANPLPDLSDTDIRELQCWLNPDNDPACDFNVFNIAARGPWDHDFNAGAPTFTTIGNAAITAEAWLSPLTPAEQYRPTSPTRIYSFEWSNDWNNTLGGCSPTEFVFGVGNDINAAIVNMFVDHNRMHDWSYHLGFTEINSNGQVDNFGNTASSRENDPEIGNVQAGAIDGAFPAYLGRDNANQITLQDGVAPITNQYLWQALAGTIYVPCADGNYDMGIVGHEYGHMIQNRMIGGPNQQIGSDQGRRMGESWSDLTGMEIQNEYGFVPVADESPFAIGVYVLGSPERGIRNYNMSDSPLNFSNMQYDPFGNTSPHADGEIWSPTNFDIRELLIQQHNGTYPATDAVRQRGCAEGDFNPDDCPGNRRWIQIMHDAFLLQPSATNYLIARDAYLAADLMRFTGNPQFGDHQDNMWLAFARRGMGVNASTTGGGDLNPTPGFALPGDHPLANASLDFSVRDLDDGVTEIEADVYIGHYEARSNPIVTTNTGADPVDIAPGNYDLLVVADGYGHTRLNRTFAVGETGNVVIFIPPNVASASSGASASGDGSQHGQLIDDTEATSWDFTGQVGLGEQVVTIDLNGAKAFNRVQASALSENAGNRFRQLRQFAVSACTSGLAVDCDLPIQFTEIFVSDINAFNGEPIRPLAPDLIMQSFDVPETTATHVRFRVLHNQCTGSGLGTPEPDGFTDSNWAPGAPPPDTDTDCRRDDHPIFPPKDLEVHAAEFQVFANEGFLDSDDDTIPDDQDNCPQVSNADQADDDGDGVGNLCDNCLEHANPSQCNTNADVDPFGNRCDADLNNDGGVTQPDLGIFRNEFGKTGADLDADLNCDGGVTQTDLGIFRSLFNRPPGPSGLNN